MTAPTTMPTQPSAPAPQYAVERASDTSTEAKFTAARNANLLGDASSDDAEEDLTAIINAELPDALMFIDSEMGAKRAKATEYYMGALFGNEEDGRSKVISRDVLAVVQAMLPSIMRTFFGGRRRVRYRPTKAEDVQHADQATAFTNAITMQVDNNGFLEFYEAFKDALIRYQGILKWWWDDAREVTTESYTGQDQDGLLLLANDTEIEDLRVYEEDVPEGRPKTYAALAKRVVKHAGKSRFGAVAPEELLINRDARSLREARFLDHRRLMLTGELVAMGYVLEDILPYVSQATLQWSPEVAARAPLGISTFMPGMGQTNNELQLPITYHECYLRADMDGDDFPELIRACGAGDGAIFTLLHWEPVSEIPFASLDTDPEPHTLIGLCPGGNVLDVQLIKSALLRLQMDGAALALEPRLEVVEHMVELDDLLNPEITGIVRTKAPGQVNAIRYDYNPVATQGLLEYMDQVREERSRQSRPSQGLDADALQSSAKLAVAATLSGAQQQIELICRLMAEGGIKDLYRGLLRLSVRHASEARWMRFHGEWTQVDPRTWNADMDVEIEVGMGVGGVEMEIQALQERKVTQEAILTNYGADNPMVSLAQYRDTIVKLDELRGLPDTDAAYKPIDPNFKPPAPPPSEAQTLQQTAQAELALKEKLGMAELALKHQDMLLQDQRERIKIANDFQAKLAMAVAQSKAQVDVATFEHTAELQRDQLEHEATLVEHLIGGATDMHAANVQAAAAPAPAEAPNGG